MVPNQGSRLKCFMSKFWKPSRKPLSGLLSRSVQKLLPCIWSCLWREGDSHQVGKGRRKCSAVPWRNVPFSLGQWLYKKDWAPRSEPATLPLHVSPLPAAQELSWTSYKASFTSATSSLSVQKNELSTHISSTVSQERDFREGKKKKKKVQLL